MILAASEIRLISKERILKHVFELQRQLRSSQTLPFRWWLVNIFMEMREKIGIVMQMPSVVEEGKSKMRIPP